VTEKLAIEEIPGIAPVFTGTNAYRRVVEASDRFGDELFTRARFRTLDENGGSATARLA